MGWEFLSWIWNYPKRRRGAILKQLKTHEGRVNVVILRDDAAVDNFVAGLPAKSPEAAETTMSDDFFLLSIFFTLSMCANVGLGIALFRTARHVRRLERQAPGESTDRRVAQLEETIDAMGAQLDQLASGQEFLNRMVAKERERAPRRLPDVHEITPH